MAGNPSIIGTLPSPFKLIWSDFSLPQRRFLGLQTRHQPGWSRSYLCICGETALWPSLFPYTPREAAQAHTRQYRRRRDERETITLPPPWCGFSSVTFTPMWKWNLVDERGILFACSFLPLLPAYLSSPLPPPFLPPLLPFAWCNLWCWSSATWWPHKPGVSWCNPRAIGKEQKRVLKGFQILQWGGVTRQWCRHRKRKGFP